MIAQTVRATNPSESGISRMTRKKLNAMPLSNLLKSAAAPAPSVARRPASSTREHPDCRRTYDTGFQEMVRIAAQAARTHSFDEKTLRLSLAEIARRSHGDGATVNQALEEGWKQGVHHAMADGIMIQAEETSLREFRDRLALAEAGADQQATAQLEKASKDRLTLDARVGALVLSQG